MSDDEWREDLLQRYIFFCLYEQVKTTLRTGTKSSFSFLEALRGWQAREKSGSTPPGQELLTKYLPTLPYLRYLPSLTPIHQSREVSREVSDAANFCFSKYVYKSWHWVTRRPAAGPMSPKSPALPQSQRGVVPPPLLLLLHCFKSMSGIFPSSFPSFCACCH